MGEDLPPSHFRGSLPVGRGQGNGVKFEILSTLK
jgi:hypothetical protein